MKHLDDKCLEIVRSSGSFGIDMPGLLDAMLKAIPGFKMADAQRSVERLLHRGDIALNLEDVRLRIATKARVPVEGSTAGQYAHAVPIPKRIG